MRKFVMEEGWVPKKLGSFIFAYFLYYSAQFKNMWIFLSLIQINPYYVENAVILVVVRGFTTWLSLFQMCT